MKFDAVLRSVQHVVAAATVIAVLAGCADTPPEKEGGMGGGPDAPGGPGRGGFPPGPPPFLAGPMGAALPKNSDGFTAHMTMQIRLPEGRTDLIEGELMGKGSKLLFIPEPAGRRGKEMRAAKISFTWDVSDGHGHVLSEGLQASAPISANAKYTITASGPVNDRPPADKVEGHHCEVQNVTVSSDDGSTTALRVWRASDLKGFPIQIAIQPDLERPALKLSKIRPASPGAELFAAPDGFTKYRTMQAMMSELMLRQASMKQRPPPEGGPEGEHGPPGGDRSNPNRSY
jgi:hypothetical protein